MAAMTALTLGTALFGTGMGVFGRIKQGRAERDAANAQAARDERNAAYADTQATDAIERGREEEGFLRSDVKRMIGAQRAGFAGQGVVVDRGSSADVKADTLLQQDQDVRRIRINAKREALGFQVEAEDLRAQADIARRTGKAAMSAAKWDAANTIIGTGASLMQTRWGWGKSGSHAGGGRPLLPSRQGLMSYTLPAAPARG